MKISYFPQYLPGNSTLVFPQLLDAIAKTDQLVENDLNADVAVIWSVLWYGRMSPNKAIWEKYQQLNKPVIVIEVGGLIRNGSWKLAINGINRDADFALDLGYDSKRLSKFNIQLKDWHKQGSYIVVAGQHGYSEQWRNMPPMDQYYRQLVSDIRSKTDKPIVLRSHPRFRENIHFKITDPNWYTQQNCEWNIAKQIQQTYDSFDFENQLTDTYCVYSHSSNAGLTSIINGVPAVVSKHSLAYEMTSLDLDNLNYPDRHEWLCKLSYTEWFADEIETQWLRIRNKL